MPPIAPTGPRLCRSQLKWICSRMTRFAAGISVIMALVSVGALTLAVSTMPRLTSADNAPQNVASVALFTSPENFHGAIVTVTGFLVAEEGESALYLSEDDATARTGNKFALALDKFARAELEQADKLYVQVTGTFQRQMADSSLGTIADVIGIVPAIRGPGGRLRYDEALEVSPQGGR